MVFRYTNGLRPLEQLRTEMDRLWSGFLGTAGDGPWFGLVRSQPPVNLWERDDALLLELEIPGVRTEQVDISVVGDELTLKVDRPDVQQEGVTYHRRERPAGSFTRVLRLPTDVDAERVEAELRDGVLTVTLPKAASAKPRKITVKT